MAGNNENHFSDAQREEIKELVRVAMIENGFGANGPETREKNIKRTQFIDNMMERFDNISVNVGRAITYAIITALLALLWLGFKTKILS